MTGLLAAYQVVIGIDIDGLGNLAITSYTISFGVLLVTALILIILDFEILENPPVVIVSTIIPLFLSLGLVSQYIPEITSAYTIFTIAGFSAVILSRFVTPGKIAVIVLAIVHGISGLLIFALPIVLSLRGRTPVGFIFVGVGGALIGIGGLLLSFLKMGKPILSKETILTIFPGLLLLMMTAFVVGFALA